MPTYKDKNTGKWYCKFYYTDWTGTKKQKLKRGFSLQREAKEYERYFLETHTQTPDISFTALVEQYLSFKQNRIKDTALKNQKDIINNHILPYFEKKNLSDITAADIAAWQNEILSAGFSASFSRTINAHLRMLFN